MDKFIQTPAAQVDGFKNLPNTLILNVPKVNQQTVNPEFDVSLTFVNAKVFNGEYTFLFSNSINSRELAFSGRNIRASQIDMKKLQSKIMSNVKNDDLKYIKLKQFTTSRTIFAFDIDAWLDDALKGSIGRVYLSKFDKEFRLTKLPPAMVRHYGLRIEFSRYVASYFKEYSKKKPQHRSTLFSIIPKSFENSIRTHASNMFDYEYDFQSNRIIVRLKTIFITGLMFSAFSLSDANNKRQKFDDMVKKNLMTFPEGKINKIAPKRFF